MLPSFTSNSRSLTILSQFHLEIERDQFLPFAKHNLTVVELLLTAFYKLFHHWSVSVNEVNVWSKSTSQDMFSLSEYKYFPQKYTLPDLFTVRTAR